ncbi:MAG: PD-(D/E)XK nuclease domain-containing protein [Wolbachia pipientis]
MSNKPELIELLLSNLKEFEKKFQELLNRVPNIHSPNKVEFFTHFFLGSILTLSHSKLVKKCNIENILFKLIKNEQGLIKVVKLFFKAQEKLIFVTMTTAQDVEHYDIDELKEIATKLEIKFIDEYDIQGKAFRIYTEKSIEQQGKPFKLNTQNLKIKDGLQEKELCQAFKEVFDQPSTHTTGFSVVDLTSGEGFESDILKLSNLDVNKVKGAVEQIFKKLASIYQELLNKTESAYHGFVYGFLAMNFKYKYDLDCYVERIEGKGYTDLTLISRKDNRRNKNWKAIPVVVEFKAGKEIVDKAIKQIKDRGYLYTPLSMRTFAQRGVIAGVNFALNLAVAVEEVEIYQSQGFMNKLLSGISSLLGTKDIVQRDNIKNDLKETVEKEIKYLYFAASGVRTENYLSRLILGQMLATKVANGSKYIFIHNNQDFDFDDKDGIRKGKSKQVSTFIIKKQSESFVFSIVEYTGQEEKYNLTGKILTRRQKAAQDKEIFENQLVPDIGNEYTQLNIKVEASSELTVDVSYVSDFANKEYQGKLVKIGDVTIDSFFDLKAGDKKDEDQESQNKAINMLEKKLFPHKINRVRKPFSSSDARFVDEL